MGVPINISLFTCWRGAGSGNRLLTMSGMPTLRPRGACAARRQATEIPYGRCSPRRGVLGT